MDITAAVPAPAKAINEENPDIYFSADAVENNQELQTITALGNVEIIRNNLTLKADKVIYNQKEEDVYKRQDNAFVAGQNRVEQNVFLVGDAPEVLRLDCRSEIAVRA